MIGNIIKYIFYFFAFAMLVLYLACLFREYRYTKRFSFVKTIITKNYGPCKQFIVYGAPDIFCANMFTLCWHNNKKVYFTMSELEELLKMNDFERENKIIKTVSEGIQ